MKKIIFTGIACIALMSGGCTDIAEDQDENRFVICPGFGEGSWTEAQPLEKVAAENIDKSNGFATSLFKTVYSGEDGNICISPISVFATFAMMANGDKGESRDEILKILGYGEAPGALCDLNIYCNALMTEVPMLNGATQCGFTNSIWYKPNLQLLPEFASAIQMIFDGNIFPTWLGDESGRTKINEFVSDHTCGMIPEFLSSPLDVKLAFLNTTYFKGTWKTEFNSKNTTKRIFSNLDGSETKTDFMWMYDEIAYCAANGIMGVRLPYSGDRYTMTILQPNEAEGFNSMIENLDSQTLKDLDTSFSSKDIILEMPKFETEINLSIIDYLTEIGFDKVCNQGIFNAANEILELTEFNHAVKIIVNEEGTEGAAASLAGMENDGPGDQYNPILISFNRPFVYIIRDTISNSILFIGAMTGF